MLNTLSLQMVIEPADNHRLVNLCGQFDEHLKLIERRLAVKISNRGNQFKIEGLEKDINACQVVIESLYKETETSILDNQKVHLFLQDAGIEEILNAQKIASDEISIITSRGQVKPRGENQANYLSRILSHDINFGIGPAGTGKTYLAVACAVQALNENRVRRLILTRPAVEAGENLGFLPGNLTQKIDPYLRPLYDALYDMLGYEKVHKLIERNVIEVAPLAFMRGRSLNESFIILDEAQNTTAAQMKMFLTRIGFGSTAIVTGDITQIDLPNKQVSGLEHSLKILKKVKGISFTWFDSKDVVRHPLVQRIVNAYDKHDDSLKKQKLTAKKFQRK